MRGAYRVIVRAACCMFVLVPQLSFANSAVNMRQGVTDISEEVYQLHMTIFLICCAIALVVFGLMFWAMLRHRKSKGRQAAQFHESTKIEVLWTAIPFVILILMAIPATQTLIKMEDSSKADLTIKVTASQWKWHYQYLNYGQQELDVGYYSILSTPQEQIDNQAEKPVTYLLEVDKPLVIPIDKKVRFLFTSDDVIHAWWVPDFAVKKDAVPGFINESWTRVNETGVYRGQCAELCGKNHGYMPIVVEAKTEQAFTDWLVGQQELKLQQAQEELALLSTTLSKEELLALGQDVYTANCSACHQPSGQGLPGVFPALKGGPITTGPVDGHIDIVLNGKPATAMQAFAKQLSLKQLAAVITYERNAWGNETGDVVQPKQITTFINGLQQLKSSKPALETVKEPQQNQAMTPKSPETQEKPIEATSDAQTMTKQQLMTLGESAYLAQCAACHQASGLGLAGVFPALKDSPIAKGPIEAHIDIVLNGKPGTAMQGYAKHLSAKELAAIITYERNAWGNEMGDLLQPQQVEDVIRGNK